MTDSTSARTESVSPGRTGVSQRISSIPGEPSEASFQTFASSVSAKAVSIV